MSQSVDRNDMKEFSEDPPSPDAGAHPDPDLSGRPDSVAADDVDAFQDNTADDDRLQDIDDADPFAPLKDPFPAAQSNASSA